MKIIVMHGTSPYKLLPGRLNIVQSSVISLGFTITRWKEPIDGDTTHFGGKTKEFILRLSLAG